MEASLPTLKETIRAYGLRAKKRLGQNFLLDPYLLSRIVKVAGDLQGKTVIEVGPGPGGLTRAILEKSPQSLHVIEMDPTCVDIMQELQHHFPNQLHVIEGDALKVPCDTLGTSPRLVIANLPYNVSVPLLFQWLDNISAFESLTLMFQKEVAHRITARPRTSDYSKLSVMAQWCCDARIMFDVPPGAFSPPPKVTSSIVHIAPKANPIPVDAKNLGRVTQAAFNQRRKMLRASLKSVCADPINLLEKVHIDPTKRAEELSVEEFCALANAFENVE